MVQYSRDDNVFTAVTHKTKTSLENGLDRFGGAGGVAGIKARNDYQEVMDRGFAYR